MAATESNSIRFSDRGGRFRVRVARVLALCTFFGSGIVVATFLDVTPASASTIAISGTFAGQSTTDEVAITPFSGVVISDVGSAQTDTVTITLSNPANGTLANLGGGTYNAATGVYSVSGSSTVVTTAVDGLQFSPTAHQVAPGISVSTTFAINVTDTASNSATDSTTTVMATAVNDAPVIIGTVAGQTTTDQSALSPFSGVGISDVDFGQSEAVTITLSAPANGALSNLGGGSYNPATGVYSVSGTDAAVTTAVDGMLFTPTVHQVAPGNTVSTTFTIHVVDTAGGSNTGSTTTAVVTATGAADGSGVIGVTGSSLVASSTLNTLTFTYTAAAGGTNAGKVDVVVPVDFGVPQLTSGASANYVSATSGATASVAGQTIVVSGVTLAGAGTFSLTIANLTAPSTPETETFATSERSTAAGTLVALAASPSVLVTSPPVTVPTRSPQSITFSSSPPSNPSVGGSYTPVALGGASGNPVTFAIAPSSSSNCSISGSTVSFSATGSCVIEANQAGNANYAAASQVSQSVVIAPAGVPTLSTSISRTSATIGTRVTFTGTVTTTSGTPADGGTLTFSIGDTKLCSATVSSGHASCSTTNLSRAGALTVITTFSGSTNALPAHSTFSLAVSRGRVTMNGNVRSIGLDLSEYTTTVRAADGGFGSPKGSIIFLSGTRAICSAPLRGDTAHCVGTTVSGVVTARYRPDAAYVGETKVIRK